MEELLNEEYGDQPLIFLLFINDVAPYITKKPLDLIISLLKIIQFANDMLLILSNKDLNDLEVEAYIVLNLFAQWCAINLLNMNLCKTNYMLCN